ncbi:MAG: hypothetical protein QOD86_3027 [Miltoncostaeaceae bacterium]|jgi:hypothetical protein|nr:hypothetical protein [Miltoncostaeaceae bacterium]
MGLIGGTLSFAARIMIALLIAIVAIGLGIAFHPILFLLLLVALLMFVF